MTPQGKEISLGLKDHVNVILQERRSNERGARVRTAAASGSGAAADHQSPAGLSLLIVDGFYGAPDTDTSRDESVDR